MRVTDGRTDRIMIFKNAPNWETPYFLEKLTLPLDSHHQRFLFTVQLLYSYDCKNGRFLRKTALYNKKFLIWGTGVVVENFWTKVPKGTPLRQIWSNKSFGYVPVAMLWRYTTARKKAHENSHWKLESSVTLQYPCSCDRRISNETAYTVSQNNDATLHSCTTMAYVDRFSKLFHSWIQQGICNNISSHLTTAGHCTQTK